MFNKANNSVGGTEKIEKFISGNRKVLLSILLLLVVAVVAFAVVVGVSESGIKKGLAVLDSAEYAFTAKSDNLSESEIVARQAAVMESVSPYLCKKNIVGVRANMLAADVAFQKKDFGTALGYYEAASSLGTSYYTSPICKYNSAVCCEELGKKEDAVRFYEEAASADYFYLATHAAFNVGRVNEELGAYDKAEQAYQKIVETIANDVWANLAQSRLIALKTAGKIN